jgi:hypothetical protein
MDPPVIFGPVIEDSGPYPFITEDPFKSPHPNNIPTIIGINSKEGVIKTTGNLCI